jgi:hypothetical protein
MEPEHREDHHESERKKTEPSAPSAGQTVFNPPFANDGLEQVRDSYC